MQALLGECRLRSKLKRRRRLANHRRQSNVDKHRQKSTKIERRRKESKNQRESNVGENRQRIGTPSRFSCPAGPLGPSAGAALPMALGCPPTGPQKGPNKLNKDGRGPKIASRMPIEKQKTAKIGTAIEPRFDTLLTHFVPLGPPEAILWQSRRLKGS